MRPTSTPREIGAREDGPRHGLLSRSRRLAYTALAGGALLLTACGNGDPNNNNPDGGAGGTGGSGGIDGGAGAGGEAGSDPCANLKFEGLGSKVYDVNENGSFSVTGLTGSEQAYNGLTFEVKDGAMFTKRTRIGLEKVIYDNYQPGYDKIGDVSGIRPYAIDENKHYVDDGQGIGNCVLNRVALNESILNDPLKRPVMRTPEGYYTTVFKVKDNSESVNDYSFMSTRTEFTLDSLTSDYILGNSKPDVSAALTRDSQGHLVLDLNGTTDEGFGDDTVLSKLNANADGVTFAPVNGQPGKFRTIAPSNLTSLNLSVEGPNQPLTNDTTNATVGVSCDGINTNGHGTCNEGLVTCDPGFANDDADQTDDCDGCDIASGLYENDYPVCSPDTTPPNAPVITTNGGGNFSINQANFTLEGTTDADTDEVWAKAVKTSNPGAGTVLFDWSPVNGYVPNNTNWLYNGSIPNVFEGYNYCFRAEDKANNQSGEDCINIFRAP